MKLLVLVADYPRTDGRVALMYVHVRNKYYLQHGLDVTVINFAAKEKYKIDGINVITLSDYENSDEKYDILVSHAPNIRGHYIFLKRYEGGFSNIVFFFHGHEVLKINHVYPKPYSYMKQKTWIEKFVQNYYDEFKLMIWRRYFPKIANKSLFVFVSNWMYDEFLKWTKIEKEIIEKRSVIIPNSVGKIFETENYDKKVEKRYDFITIRNLLDGSKYSIDIVNNLAINNPTFKFLVVGQGKFFEHNKKADNLVWKDGTLSHDEMISYLNASRCALMPTRTDAQGVMMCEMATFGIPLITSDIPVCHDICNEFTNVRLIKNNNTNIDLIPILNDLESAPFDNTKTYFTDNCCGAEVQLYKKLI